MIIKLVGLFIMLYITIKTADFLEYIDASRKARQLNKRAISNNSVDDTGNRTLS